ncbi:MAG: hypothetical protein RBG13Loki_1109 [Promethearchaeota archaeon CR_4]|nr:MAG: hypothetical protein RBG13Loki_1109 [Candidatus Lokiarchaeota archaeon CR_4]
MEIDEKSDKIEGLTAFEENIKKKSRIWLTTTILVCCAYIVCLCIVVISQANFQFDLYINLFGLILIPLSSYTIWVIYKALLTKKFGILNWNERYRKPMGKAGVISSFLFGFISVFVTLLGITAIYQKYLAIIIIVLITFHLFRLYFKKKSSIKIQKTMTIKKLKGSDKIQGLATFEKYIKQKRRIWLIITIIVFCAYLVFMYNTVFSQGNFVFDLYSNWFGLMLVPLFSFALWGMYKGIQADRFGIPKMDERHRKATYKAGYITMFVTMGVLIVFGNPEVYNFLGMSFSSLMYLVAFIMLITFLLVRVYYDKKGSQEDV